MSGKNYFFDTNAIIALLKGDEKLLRLTHEASWIGISIISKLEFLCFPKISSKDIETFNAFVERVNLINIDNGDIVLIKEIISIRKKYKLKLPDAIIVSSAKKKKAILVTQDKQLLNKKYISSISY